MARMLLVPVLAGAALAPRSSKAQAVSTGVALLRVGGSAPPTFSVDVPQVFREDEPVPGLVAVKGEYLQLQPGEHELVFESRYAQSLRVRVRVADERVELLSHSIESAGCTHGPVRVISTWPVKLAPDSGHTGAQVLKVGRVKLGSDGFSASCTMGPGKWGTYKSWSLKVASSPADASILVDGVKRGSTNTTMSIVYGVAANGSGEDKKIRVAKEGYVSDCAWRLTALREGSTQDVSCILQRPGLR